jgi:hypothetical protein
MGAMKQLAILNAEPLAREEGYRLRKMEEMHEWEQWEQAQAAISEAQEPQQRFILPDGQDLEA